MRCHVYPSEGASGRLLVRRSIGRKNDKYLDRRYRKANAYEALDHLLATALDKSATLQRRLDKYHKASSELVYLLSSELVYWLSLAGGGRQDLSNPLPVQLAPVSVPGLFFASQ